MFTVYGLIEDIVDDGSRRTMQCQKIALWISRSTVYERQMSEMGGVEGEEKRVTVAPDVERASAKTPESFRPHLITNAPAIYRLSA